MTDIPALIARVGPKETVTRSCFGCSACKSESYAVQGDSGHNVYCTHPTVGCKHIADTSWSTPDWCPAVAAPALATALKAAMAENERLREALREIAGYDLRIYGDSVAHEMRGEARAALEETK